VAVEGDGEEEEFRGVHAGELFLAKDRRRDVAEVREVVLLVVGRVLGEEGVDLAHFGGDGFAEGAEAAAEVEGDVLPFGSSFDEEAHELAVGEHLGDFDAGFGFLPLFVSGHCVLPGVPARLGRGMVNPLREH